MAYKATKELMTSEELVGHVQNLKTRNYKKVEGGSSKLPLGKVFKGTVKGYRPLQDDEQLTFFILYVFAVEIDGKVQEDTVIQNGKLIPVGEQFDVESYTDAKSGRIFNRFAVKKVNAVPAESAPALQAIEF